MTENVFFGITLVEPKMNRGINGHWWNWSEILEKLPNYNELKTLTRRLNSSTSQLTYATVDTSLLWFNYDTTEHLDTKLFKI